MSGRPPVSVVVPFAGLEADLYRLLAALETLSTTPRDELIVADNRPRARARTHNATRIIAAGGTPTPAFARNRGAETAGNPWIVFLDADTQPAPELLDAYFAPAPADTTGLLAGGIEDRAAEPTLAARYSVARRHMAHATTLERGAWSYAQTANCAVRRSALGQVGGFDPGARAGEDADLCFRLRVAGWSLESRPAAAVAHLARPGTRALLTQLARHGAGAAWCEQRHPGSFPRPAGTAALIAHHCRAAVVHAARREPDEAAFAVLDLLGTAAFALGRHLPNAPARRLFPPVRRG